MQYINQALELIRPYTPGMLLGVSIAALIFILIIMLLRRKISKLEMETASLMVTRAQHVAQCEDLTKKVAVMDELEENIRKVQEVIETSRNM